MSNEVETVDETTGEIIEDTTTVNRDLMNTLHPRTMEERKAAYNAVNNALSLDDIGDTKIKITAIVQVNGVRVDRKTTEEVPCINTTLVAVDGKGYFSQSSGIARSAYNLILMFGAKWPEPLEVHVKKTTLANKNTLKTLVVD